MGRDVGLPGERKPSNVPTLSSKKIPASNIKYEKRLKRLLDGQGCCGGFPSHAKGKDQSMWDKWDQAINVQSILSH